MAAAIADDRLRFEQAHPLWAQLTPGEARELMHGLRDLGFRYDPHDGWYGDRSPQPRDLALALAFSGIEAIALRPLPTAKSWRSCRRPSAWRHRAPGGARADPRPRRDPPHRRPPGASPRRHLGQLGRCPRAPPRRRAPRRRRQSVRGPLRGRRATRSEASRSAHPSYSRLGGAISQVIWRTCAASVIAMGRSPARPRPAWYSRSSSRKPSTASTRRRWRVPSCARGCAARSLGSARSRLERSRSAATLTSTVADMSTEASGRSDQNRHIQCTAWGSRASG